MKIYYDTDGLKPIKKAVVTIGTFDGVHIGHQEIFRMVQSAAEESGGETVVITFHPHPRLVIHPDSKDLKFINTQEKKIEFVRQAGIDYLIVIPFTKEFANTPSGEFVRNVLVEKIKTKKLIIGYDHQFGKDRYGSIGELKGLGKIHSFEVVELPVQTIDGVAVSSTKIRNALNAGNVRLANKLLGYEYSITGKVVRGNRIGQTIGFPTANIEIEDEYKLISANGVYACRVEYEGRIYKGMGNIGHRPTIDHGDLTIEVNIFDFNHDIYGEIITIFFVDRIRDEKKFENLAALRKQLRKDRVVAVDILDQLLSQ